MTDRLAEHAPQEAPGLQDEDDMYVGPEYPGTTRYLKLAPEGYAQADGPGFQAIRSDWDSKPLPGSQLTHAEEFLERVPDGVFVQRYFEGRLIDGQGIAMEPASAQEAKPVRKGAKVRIARALGLAGTKE